MTRFDDPTRAAIELRARGLCEARCSRSCRTVGDQAHHRKLRRHKDNTVDNGLWVCNVCHELIHRAGEVAYDRGLLVHWWDTPGDIAVEAGLFIPIGKAT